VSTQVVTAPGIKQRALTIERFIQLGQKLVEFRNFNSLMEILAGLNRASVQRLKKTWEEVKESAVDDFQELNMLMDTRQNYKNYRGSLAKSILPALPYFGIYLRDITFIEEGNEAKVGGLVNFEKIQLHSKRFREVLYFQKIKYSFTEDEALQAFLQKLSVIGKEEEQLFKQSQIIEPSNSVDL